MVVQTSYPPMLFDTSALHWVPHLNGPPQSSQSRHRWVKVEYHLITQLEPEYRIIHGHLVKPVLAEDAVAVRRRPRREAEVVERAAAGDGEVAGAGSAFPRARGEAEQSAAAGGREEQHRVGFRGRHLRRQRRCRGVAYVLGRG